MKERDRVIVFDRNGNEIGEGTIVSINEFREPSLKYAVAVDYGYLDDYYFCSESQLKLK